MISSFLSVFFSKVIIYIKFKEMNCKAYPKQKSRLNFKKITCKRFNNKNKELVILKVGVNAFYFNILKNIQPLFSFNDIFTRNVKEINCKTSPKKIKTKF